MKRILSIIVVISMMFSMVVYAENTSDNVHELDLSGYDSFIQMLEDIDINMPLLELDSSLKKGDFIKSLNALFGYSQMSASYKTTKNEYEGEIETAYALGYITDKESFAADDTITLKEASKCMINALGYGVTVRLMGGTDEIYHRETVNLGLENGITSGWENPISYAQMLKMFYNAMDIKMLVSDNDGGYFERGNLLWEKHEIELLKGLVTANKQSSVAGNACGINQIEIDSKVYECADEKAHMLLGQYAYCLIREDVILHVSAPQKRNKITVVQNEDVEDFSSLKELEYLDENEKIDVLEFEYPPTIIVNGTLKKISNISELKILIAQNGELEAIDNDSDGKYEILKVTNYVTYVVDMINYAKSTIIDQHINKVIEFNGDNDNLTVIKDKNVIDFSDIKVGDVIEICSDKAPEKDTGDRIVNYKNSEYITVLVSDASIGGIVNWIDDEKLSIDETEFELSDYFNNAVNDDEMEKIQAGMSGAFFVNHSGKIVYVNTAPNVLDKYGFLVWGDYLQEYGRVCFKIYTTEGEVKLFELSDKVMVDGTSYKNNERFVTINQLFANNNIKNQLVIYRLNSKNMISYIDTAKFDDEKENEDTTLRMDMEFYSLGTASKTLLTSGKYNSHGPVYTNNSYQNVNIRGVNEKLFVVSGFENAQAHDNLQIINATGASKNFEITTSSYFGVGDYQFDDGKCIMFYNIGDDNTSEYMVYYNPLLSENSLPEVSASSDVAFYVGEGETLNQNDEVTKYIKVYMPGESELKTLVCKNQNVLNNIETTSYDGGGSLKRGDIIRFNLTAQGEISAIKRDVDFAVVNQSLKDKEEPGCFAAPVDIESPQNYSTLVRWLGTRSSSYFTLMSRKTNWESIGISQASKLPVYRAAFKGTSSVLIYDVNADEFVYGTLDDLFAADECGENASVMYVRHTVSNASIILAYNFM